MLSTISELDATLLYYLDVCSIISFIRITKEQYEILTKIDFVKELCIINKQNEILNDVDLVYLASVNGFVSVLEWFKNTEFEFKYTKHAINGASANAHINVLEWFKNSPYEFKYSASAINMAAENKHINVLEWFLNSPYEFKYSTILINQGVSDWFADNIYL